MESARRARRWKTWRTGRGTGRRRLRSRRCSRLLRGMRRSSVAVRLPSALPAQHPRRLRRMDCGSGLPCLHCLSRKLAACSPMRATRMLQRCKWQRRQLLRLPQSHCRSSLWHLLAPHPRLPRWSVKLRRRGQSCGQSPLPRRSHLHRLRQGGAWRKMIAAQLRHCRLQLPQPSQRVGEGEGKLAPAAEVRLSAQ